MNGIQREKRVIVDKLNLLKGRIETVNNDFELDLSELNNKVITTLKNIEKDKFSIAFFGAFSDGKSTILSVLTDNLEIDISPEPKTDKVTTYEYGDYMIIDTPGLFSENAIHDEITKKYISEANVIIYTVDPVNSLKTSHHSTLKWLLSDISKMDSTIFAINKMDEVADIEDEEDFLHHSKIKTQVVSDEINNLIGERPKNILCLAADPYQEGYETWKEEIEEYNELSRIPLLRSKIDEFIIEYKDSLIMRAGVSVIKESILYLNKDLSSLEKSVENETELLTNQCKESKNKLKILNNDVVRSYEDIKEGIINLRKNMILEFKSVQTSLDLSDVIDIYIGKDAYLLEEKINSIIRNHTVDLREEVGGVYQSISETFDYYSTLDEKLMANLGKGTEVVLKGLLSGSTKGIANSILKIRNVLKIPFKFKPWGAVKLAKIMKGLPLLAEVLGFAFSAITHYKLEKNISEVNSSLKEAFDKLIREELTYENYCETYFPELKTLNTLIDELDDSVNNLKQVSQNIKGIKKVLESDKYL